MSHQLTKKNNFTVTILTNFEPDQLTVGKNLIVEELIESQFISFFLIMCLFLPKSLNY